MRVSALRADRAFDFWGCSQTLPDFCKIAANPDGIARELNDIFAMTLFCDFEAPQAAISALSGDGVVEGGTGELHRMENKQ